MNPLQKVFTGKRTYQEFSFGSVYSDSLTSQNKAKSMMTNAQRSISTGSNQIPLLENTNWMIHCSSQKDPLPKEIKKRIKQIVVNREYLSDVVRYGQKQQSILKSLFCDYNYFQYPKLFRLLVNNGSDINERDNSMFKGNTILIWTIANAFYQNAIKFIELGIDLGLDFNLSDESEKNTALLLSLKKGCRQDPEGWEKLVKLLTLYTTHVDAQDVEGNSALHVAAFRRESEFVHYLISAGANIKLRNEFGQTAADLWSVQVNDLTDENLQNICGYVNDEDVTFNISERNQRRSIPPEELMVKKDMMSISNILNRP